MATIQRPVRSELQTPEVKASTGLTYEHFSQTLEKFVRPDDHPSSLISVLYEAVRLPQWQFVSNQVEPLFEIWDVKESVRVFVTQKTVTTVVKGVRNLPIAKGLDAAALFNSIKHAQDLISKNTNVVDNSADEDFFNNHEEEASAALDAVFREDKLDTDAEPEVKRSAPTLSLDGVLKHIKSVQGRVLTIMDAVLSDKQQREAVKTLVSKEFREEMNKVSRHFYSEVKDGD